MRSTNRPRRIDQGCSYVPQLGMLGGLPPPPRPPPLLPPSAIRTAKFELNHLIDAAKQQAASIKCEVRIDQVRINQVCFLIVWSMRASKSPHRSNAKYESIKFESIKSVFNHLIDAGKQKPASIKWEERIDQVRINQVCFLIIWSMRARKSPHR